MTCDLLRRNRGDRDTVVPWIMNESQSTWVLILMPSCSVTFLDKSLEPHVQEDSGSVYAEPYIHVEHNHTDSLAESGP